MSLWELFWIFVYIGTFTIGGGLVALTLMQQELVGRGLISPERFFNMMAISESTPGPIGINMATYLGFELFGIPGALITTFGTVLPSLIVIIIIARWFDRFREQKPVRAAFYGLRAGTTGMIAVAAWHVIRIALLRLPQWRISGKWQDMASWPAVGLFAVLLVLSRFLRWHPVFFVAIGAVFGIFFL